MRLEKDAVHDALPGLTELIDRVWDETTYGVPSRRRRGRILLAVREVVLLFMAEGPYVAFLGREVQRPTIAGGIALSLTLTDASALDSRIWPTIKSSDLPETWAEGLGNEVRGAVRRCCVDVQSAIEFMDTSPEI
eukprot:529628-Pyramimonas_sp.AAC.1